jgi:hypothetical protein
LVILANVGRLTTTKSLAFIPKSMSSPIGCALIEIKLVERAGMFRG